MTFSNPGQLKHQINKKADEYNLTANTVLQNFMMERLLERIALSKYSQHFVLKGGFLIAAMIGMDIRNTLDMDATTNGIPINRFTHHHFLCVFCDEMYVCSTFDPSKPHASSIIPKNIDHSHDPKRHSGNHCPLQPA